MRLCSIRFSVPLPFMCSCMPMSDDEKERNFYIDNNSIFASFSSAQHCLCIIHFLYKYIFILFPTTQTESAATPFRKEHTFSMWKTAVKYIYMYRQWGGMRFETRKMFNILPFGTLYISSYFLHKKNLYFFFFLVKRYKLLFWDGWKIEQNVLSTTTKFSCGRYEMRWGEVLLRRVEFQWESPQP